jgi:hypothetical protein
MTITCQIGKKCKSAGKKHLKISEKRIFDDIEYISVFKNRFFTCQKAKNGNLLGKIIDCRRNIAIQTVVYKRDKVKSIIVCKFL